MSFFSRLSKGLSKSRDNLAAMFPGQAKEKLSDAEWQDIEDALIMADCGAGLAMNLIEQAKKSKQPMQTLKDTMQQTLNIDKPIHKAKPFVLLVAGVNGTGKTTTIGKLANMYTAQGKKVLIGAADTFRAAAVEQLAVWVERAGADIVKQAEGSDPASVAFDTISRGIAKSYDVIIIDTAGRVQTDTSLMNELAKVYRVMGKALDGCPHEVWHVVDGGTGQNAVVQVEKFREIIHTTGLIVTKLDGTGKGGVVLQLCDKFKLPVRYIGVGETLEDLMPFDANAYIDSLLPQPEETDISN
ncbi:MAG: signal recognition particle-docking protein FtsY [Zetaproteobacteria bacterium]|nr:MAG: signal recognition particle-docking protein FtsY [Zetaproteobacteria bacterium]